MDMTAFLNGERIYLRALQESDADGPYSTWFDDAEVCRGNSHHVFPYSREAARDYIRQVTGARDKLVLGVFVREDDRHVGNVSLQDIHPIYRSAEFAIVIGDKSVWGTGIGKEAATLICGHGFTAMNLHRIHCGTFEDNDGMIRLAATLGMTKEGRRRKAVFKGGRYIDVVEFGLLQDEFLHPDRASNLRA